MGGENAPVAVERRRRTSRKTCDGILNGFGVHHGRTFTVVRIALGRLLHTRARDIGVKQVTRPLRIGEIDETRAVGGHVVEPKHAPRIDVMEDGGGAG